MLDLGVNDLGQKLNVSAALVGERKIVEHISDGEDPKLRVCRRLGRADAV